MCLAFCWLWPASRAERVRQAWHFHGTKRDEDQGSRGTERGVCGAETTYVSDTSDRVDVHLLSSVHGGSRKLSAKGRWHRTAPHWMGDHAVDTVRPASRTAVADRTEALTCVLSPTTGDDATDGLTAGEILPSSSSSANQPSPSAARGACDLNQLRLWAPPLARAPRGWIACRRPFGLGVANGHRRPGSLWPFRTARSAEERHAKSVLTQHIDGA